MVKNLIDLYSRKIFTSGILLQQLMPEVPVSINLIPW